MNDPRARLLNDAPQRSGPVVYWMHREHRARDNDALLLAQRLAMDAAQPLCVLWCLAESFPGAGLRQFDFLLRGLKRTEAILREHGIALLLRRGEPGREAAAFARAAKASALVTDFDPVRVKRRWMRDVLDGADCPVWQVDGRNVVPAWLASDKREWMARTIRPKIHRQLPEFLVGHLDLRPHPHPWPKDAAVLVSDDKYTNSPADPADSQTVSSHVTGSHVTGSHVTGSHSAGSHSAGSQRAKAPDHASAEDHAAAPSNAFVEGSRSDVFQSDTPRSAVGHSGAGSSPVSMTDTAQDATSRLPSPVDWDKLLMFLDVDREVPPVDWIRPGENAALEALEQFVSGGLKHYAEGANDPNVNAVSRLSPYLHFGMLSVRRAALAVAESGRDRESVDAFLEQLIVRRELAENFVLHTEKYDTVEAFPDWALRTLDDHRDDPREHVYTLEQFEGARTHDPLWNAAQRQLLSTGYMHGYMRMYWAKKILEWSESPEAAMAIALYLNDRWQLDGRDPNGYAGVAWSIGGVHDQGWRERAVYGKIRYMNDRGAARKFKVQEYVRRYSGQPSLV